MDSVWYNIMSSVIFENLCVYDIVSVILLYVVCKGIGYQGLSWLKSECAYECNYIMKHVDITGHILHDDLSCWYVCMNSNGIYKKLFETMYITEIGNKCKTIVKQRCSDSIGQMIDMCNIQKFCKFY